MSDTTYRTFTGRAAENYERYFVPAIAAPVAAELVRAAGLQAGDRVLDVGCGTGLIARRAAEAVGATGSVSGIDVSPDMIEVAKAIPADGAPIDWRAGDATALPYPDGSFDVVLCQMTLMFLQDRSAAVREMHRVLAPGGRVVINTPGPIQPTFELMEQAIITHISPDLAGFVRMVFSMHDPAEHSALLDEAGFADVATRILFGRLRSAVAGRVPVAVHQSHADGAVRRRSPRGRPRRDGGPGHRDMATVCSRRTDTGHTADDPRHRIATLTGATG